MYFSFDFGHDLFEFQCPIDLVRLLEAQSKGGQARKLDLMKKKVVITGVSRGLGKELFIHFAEKKYFVYGILRDTAQLEEFSKKYPDHSRVILADLSSDEAIKQIQEAVQEDSIDLLINNAGIAGISTSVQDTNSTELMELFNIHCLGVLRTVKALSNNLLKAENPLVLNLNSRFGSITRQSSGVYKDLNISYSYRIAKASQNMLTNCLRSEFGAQMDIVSLHPGKMKTKIAAKDADLEPADIARKIVDYYESGKLKEVNGILEIGKEVIEW